MGQVGSSISYDNLFVVEDQGEGRARYARLWSDIDRPENARASTRVNLTWTRIGGV